MSNKRLSDINIDDLLDDFSYRVRVAVGPPFARLMAHELLDLEHTVEQLLKEAMRRVVIECGFEAHKRQEEANINLIKTALAASQLAASEAAQVESKPTRWAWDPLNPFPENKNDGV